MGLTMYLGNGIGLKIWGVLPKTFSPVLGLSLWGVSVALLAFIGLSLWGGGGL
jgi:hypothetical protein